MYPRPGLFLYVNNFISWLDVKGETCVGVYIQTFGLSVIISASYNNLIHKESSKRGVGRRSRFAPRPQLRLLGIVFHWAGWICSASALLQGCMACRWASSQYSLWQECQIIHNVEFHVHSPPHLPPTITISPIARPRPLLILPWLL